MLIGLKKQLVKIYKNCDNSSLNTTHSARNLGFTFDEHLAFSEQISSLFPMSANIHCLKKQYTSLLIITSANVDEFSKILNDRFPSKLYVIIAGPGPSTST